jgi:hypothetical protein
MLSTRHLELVSLVSGEYFKCHWLGLREIYAESHYCRRGHETIAGKAATAPVQNDHCFEPITGPSPITK